MTADFNFPPLGPTGEGEIVYPPGTTSEDFEPGDRPLYWARSGGLSGRRYSVHYQLDRPACAFRCFYPGGSAPCDESTALRFIEWAYRQEAGA